MMIAQLDQRYLAARPWKLWPRLVAYLLFEGRPLTTKGRWINPFVFAGYKLCALVPGKSRDCAPIFILGVGRSGTTVLGSILSLHREVGYLNEPKALWHAALGDDDLTGSYSRNSGRYRMGHEDATLPKRRRLQRFYRAYLRLSGSQRIVDKYPELIFRSGFLDAVFPDARKIILVRHGAETCQSVESWSAAHGSSENGHTTDWWGRNGRKWDLLLRDVLQQDLEFAPLSPLLESLTSPQDRAAVEWIASMREAIRLTKSCDNALLVRYEDLVRHPEEYLAGICDFCGLEQDQTMLDYGKAKLKQNPARSAPSIHPDLRPLFDRTLRALGY